LPLPTKSLHLQVLKMQKMHFLTSNSNSLKEQTQRKILTVDSTHIMHNNSSTTNTISSIPLNTPYFIIHSCTIKIKTFFLKCFFQFIHHWILLRLECVSRSEWKITLKWKKIYGFLCSFRGAFGTCFIRKRYKFCFWCTSWAICHRRDFLPHMPHPQVWQKPLIHLGIYMCVEERNSGCRSALLSSNTTNESGSVAESVCEVKFIGSLSYVFGILFVGF
jgi:hypothetical protein